MEKNGCTDGTPLRLRKGEGANDRSAADDLRAAESWCARSG